MVLEKKMFWEMHVSGKLLVIGIGGNKLKRHGFPTVLIIFVGKYDMQVNLMYYISCDVLICHNRTEQQNNFCQDSNFQILTDGLTA